MMRWVYVAVEASGGQRHGELDAGSIEELTERLRARGLHTERARLAPPPRRRAISAAILAPLLHGVAALLESGVPLDRAIAAIEPMAPPAVRARLAAARERLVEGVPLAVALDDQSGAWPAAALAVLQAAERNGRLARGVADVARTMDDEATLRRDLSQALAYPLMLAVVGSGAMLVLLLVVLPRFAALLADAGVALPTLTRALLTVSGAVREPGFLVALGAAGGLAVLLLTRHRDRIAAHLLHVPLIGPVRHSFATARSTQAFAMALGAGASVLGALDAARDAAADPEVATRLSTTRRQVSEGNSLTASLQQSRAWRGSVLPLIGIGEANGSLQGMAERAASLAGSEGLSALRTATRMAEPVLVLCFGGLVALMAAGMLQAVYALRPN